MERKQLTTCPFLTPIELCESQIPCNGNEKVFLSMYKYDIDKELIILPKMFLTHSVYLPLPVLLSATETARAGMEPLAVDDDICILKHETAYTAAGESPVSVCAGDESVASHFALVTAYEDIKKRLRDTERENTLLRRRVKQLEDKV